MAKKRKLKDKKIQKQIALSRIKRLFLLAENNALSGNLTIANRYVTIARKISMKYLVPIPKEFKHRFCKHCYFFLLPYVNSRYRVHRGRLIVYCNNCKRYSRILLK
jgi:ribonuclease P protein subunit RPR2